MTNIIGNITPGPSRSSFLRSEHLHHFTMPLQSLSSIPSISTPTPFKIEFGSDEVSDLISRISNARFPPAGVLPKEKDHPFILPRTETLREWAEEWKNMDFKQVANELNAHEHFKTKIDWCGAYEKKVESERSFAQPNLVSLQTFISFIVDHRGLMPSR